MKRLVPVAVAIAALAAAGMSAPQPTRAATSPKVVIVVGAMGDATLYSQYKSSADTAYTAFRSYTPNVIKVYSPTATYSAVAAAAEGANILVYVGHGSGWPNPYTATHQPRSNNGMGLSPVGATSDTKPVYSGEDAMAQLGLAPNALVLLWKACYSAGNSEDGKTAPTLAVAKQRVDGYASGFIRAGASAVIAEPHASTLDIGKYAQLLFTSSSTTSIDSIWKAVSHHASNMFSWASVHTDADGIDDFAGRGTLSQEDPDVPNPTGGNVFWRSMVAKTATTVGQILNSRLSANVTRWWGADRYECAATISKNAFPTPPVPVAFVALGSVFPDALSGAAAAAKLGGPVLLTTTTYLPDATKNELTRLKPAQIYILGGPGSVNGDVEKALQAYAPETTPVRIGGLDRYEVASNVALKFFQPGVPYAFVALGEIFPDALTGAAAAGKLGGPVLLVSSSGIPQSTADALTKLRPAQIVILGGSASVSDTIKGALASYSSNPPVRWSDLDRYSTAVAIATKVFKTPGIPYALVATGENFPDALAGAAIASKYGGPVLLVQSNAIPASVADELQRLQPQKIVVLGGPGSVSGRVRVQLDAFVAAP